MSVTLPRRLLGYVESVLMVLACVMLMLMLATMVMDAVGRYVFHRPLAGNFEFISFFGMVMLCYLAMPRAYTLGGMVRLEVFDPLLERVPFQIPARINALLGAVAFGAITFYAGAEAIEKIHSRETTIGLVQLPIYISFISFPGGCGLLTLRLVLEIFFPQQHVHRVEDEL
jgi:TRAP-type C4-dicarboxylate transport system permease small subunit